MKLSLVAFIFLWLLPTLVAANSESRVSLDLSGTWWVIPNFSEMDSSGKFIEDSTVAKEITSSGTIYLKNYSPKNTEQPTLSTTLGRKFHLDDADPLLGIASVLSIKMIGENWEVFINGKSVAREIYLEDNRIEKARLSVNQTIPLPSGLLMPGENTIVLRVLGFKNPWDNHSFLVRMPVVVKRAGGVDLSSFLPFALNLIYLFFGGYHLLMYLKRPKEVYTLYFSLYTLNTTILGFLGTSLPMLFVDDSRIVTQMQRAFLNLNLLLPMLFTYKFLYNERPFPLLLKIISICYLCLFLTNLVVDYAYIDMVLMVFLIVNMPSILGYGVFLIRSFWINSEDARLFILTTMVAYISAFLFAFGLKNYALIVPIDQIAIFFWIVSITLMLANRFTRVHNQADQMLVQLSDKNEIISHQLGTIENQLVTIKKLNANLEEKVELKTRHVRSILDNIQQGIFTLDANNKIHSDYSKYLKEVLDIKQVDLDGVFSSMGINVDQKSQIMSLVEMLNEQEHDLIYEANKHLFPTKLMRANGQYLEVDWHPIYDRKRFVEILVTIRDISQLISVREKEAEKRELIEKIEQLLPIQPEILREFFKDVGETLSVIRQELEETIESNKLEEIFIGIHTLKGHSRGLGLQKLTDNLHLCENFLNLVRDDMSHWQSKKVNRLCDKIEQTRDRYDKIAHEKLGKGTSLLAENVGLNQLEELLDIDSKRLRKRLISWTAIDSDRIIKEATDLTVVPLARDLGKAIPEVVITGRCMFRQDGAKILKNSLVHIFSNALDHGIEQPNVRVCQGKKPQAVINIGIARVDGMIEIKIQDDGQGLDIESLKSKGLTLGNITENSNLQSIADLVFVQGLSGSPEVTVYSGRGVGMGAVKSFVEEAGGSLAIELKDNSSRPQFALSLRLPSKFWHQSI